MQLHRNIVWTIILLLHACSIVRVSSYPHNAGNDDMEIITVEEAVHSINEIKNQSAPPITLGTENGEDNDDSSPSSNQFFFGHQHHHSAENDASNEPVIADDLIFLAHDRQQKLDDSMQEQRDGRPWHQRVNMFYEPEREISPVGIPQQIDLLTSAEEDSLAAAMGISRASSSSSSSSAAASSKSSEEENVPKVSKNAGVNGVSTFIGATGATSTLTVAMSSGNGRAIIPKMKSRMRYVGADKADVIDEDYNDDDDDDDTGTSATTDDDNIDDVLPNEPPIDMSDFVALIPGATVKSIAVNYYLNDPEVQRAYAYLTSPEFTVLRQHFLDLPEVSAFLKYMNGSGLDVIGFVTTLTNLTDKPVELLDEETMADLGSGSDDMVGNEIENGLQVLQITTTSPGQTDILASTEEQLNGLHGLVDSILEILPQDQILTTFFDKLESNGQFTRLVENIGRPPFAKILRNLQHSTQLRIFLLNLHNNGINITKILDSMKAYFFLGTF